MCALSPTAVLRAPQAALRCLGQLMKYVNKSPALLANIFGFFQHRNRHLRESAIKALIVGLLHQSVECSVEQVVEAMFPLLSDTNLKVQQRPVATAFNPVPSPLPPHTPVHAPPCPPRRSERPRWKP